MRTTTLSVIMRCVCVLLILHGLILNVSAFGGRILFGNVANPADYKFMLNVLYNEEKTGLLWHCSGSVISNNFVLTSAHCLFGRMCNLIELHTSDWTWDQPVTYWAAQCYIHENYVDNDSLEDIGLVRTDENLLANNLITTIDLPDPGTVYEPGTVAQIAGWGKTETGDFPDALMHATVRVFDWQLCDQIFKAATSCGNDPTDTCPIISKYTFCTKGDIPNPPGACGADSGGPVIIAGRLAGVVSASLKLNGKCVIGSPTVHMKVADYIPWIGKYVNL